LTGWKIDLYSSREWLERGGDMPLFQPLPEEDVAAEVHLSAIEGLPPATIAVLEAGGFRTLNDIIDLDRDDFLRLPGIAPEEADRIMKMIDELTTEDGSGEAAAPPDDVVPDAADAADAPDAPDAPEAK
jgi:N utilization substance protein A